MSVSYLRSDAKSWKVVCKNQFYAARAFDILCMMCNGEFPYGLDVVKDKAFEDNVEQVQGWLFKTEGMSVVITFKRERSRESVVQFIRLHICSDILSIVGICLEQTESLCVYPTRRDEFHRYINLRSIRASLSGFETGLAHQQVVYQPSTLSIPPPYSVFPSSDDNLSSKWRFSKKR